MQLFCSDFAIGVQGFIHCNIIFHYFYGVAYWTIIFSLFFHNLAFNRFSLLLICPCLSIAVHFVPLFCVLYHYIHCISLYPFLGHYFHNVAYVAIIFALFTIYIFQNYFSISLCPCLYVIVCCFNIMVSWFSEVLVNCAIVSPYFAIVCPFLDSFTIILPKYNHIVQYIPLFYLIYSQIHYFNIIASVSSLVCFPPSMIYFDIV